MTSISMKWSLTAATFGLLLCDFEHFGNNEREGIVEGGGGGPGSLGPLGPILDPLLLGALPSL